MTNMLLPIAILMPFIWAIIALLCGRLSGRVQGWLSTAGALITFSMVVSIAPDILIAGKTITLEYPWIPSLGLTLGLYVDQLSLLFALITTGFAVCTMSFSIDDMAHEKGLGRYYVWMLVFVGSMTGLTMAGDLILFFAFWEMTSLCSYGLIGFYKERTENIGAASKAFAITYFGGICLLLGIFMVYLSGSPNTFLFSEIKSQVFLPDVMVLVNGAIALFLIGAIAKSVQFPLHVWLPDATLAPSPVTAFLHAAAMVKAGIYLLARMYTLFPMSFNTPSWHMATVLIGVTTMIVGSMNMLVQEDFKRLIAYCTITQIGYMVMALGLGTTGGVASGLLHCLNHAIFKGSLFLCAGALIYATGSRSLDEYGGLAGRMHLTALACTVAAASVAGVPPLSGFVSKWMIFNACIEAGFGWAAAIGMFVSAITLAAFMKAIHSTFFGTMPERLKGVKEVPKSMTAPLAALTGITLLFGIVPQVPMKYLIGPIAGTLIGGKIRVKYFGIIAETGAWEPSIAALLLFLGIVIGVALYYLGIKTAPSLPTAEKRKPFIGGERLELEELYPSSRYFRLTTISNPFSLFYERLSIDRFYYGAMRSFVRFCDGFKKGHEGSYYGAMRSFVRFCDGFRKIQTGLMNLYLLAAVVLSLILLIFFVW